MKENKTSKKTSLLQESLIDYNNLAKKLNDSTPEDIKNLLGEQVKQAYANLLNESDEDDTEDVDYDVEEVEDTTADEDADVTPDTTEDTLDTEGETEGMDSEEETEDVEDTTEETSTDDVDDMSDEFGDYKVEGSENEYDFRNAQDDEIVKVFKRLTDNDNVTVVQNDGKVQLSDEETGAEYIIDLGSDNDSPSKEIMDDNVNTDDMNESKIFEIALNEYDSHVGYTDNYQKKDVMTTDGVSEPGKGKDIDKGVPQSTQKPWSKQKKSVAPFNGEKGKTVECGGQTGEVEAPEVAETLAKNGATGRMMGVKSHRSNSGDQATNPEKQHATSVAGEYKGSTNEDIKKKVNKILKENKQLKAELNHLTEILKEAAVTNVNLGGIIKLISENSTTQEEKRNIINRFKNEAHTVTESKNLYARINEELQQKPQSVANINEEKQYSNTNSAETINESKLYQDESLIDSLGLMHRICK